MFSNNVKNEFNITNVKIKSIKNTIVCGSIINKIKHILLKCKTNTLIELFTSANTVVKLYENLQCISENNTKYSFSNNKYTIDILCFSGKYFIIDCFHMNTITMQIYKKLIGEIYNLIVNEKLKHNIYLDKHIDNTWIFFDNIDKLEENKVQVIYSLFCQQLFNNKNIIHSIEMRYFVSNLKNDFYFSNNQKRTIYNNFYIKTTTDNKDAAKIFLNSLILLNDNERLIYLRKYIQNCFCNEKYSIDIINGLYNIVIELIIGRPISSLKKRIHLSHILKIFNQFQNNIRLNTMKHLIYEDFIINLINVYKHTI